MEYLVVRLSGRSSLEASRFIEIKTDGAKPKLSDLIDEVILNEKRPPIPQMRVDGLKDNFWRHRPAQVYMRDRGFDKATVEEFEVGFDPEVMTKKGPVPMVVVPVHDSYGNILGVNGRGIEEKVFKLSRRIPRNEMLFNLNRAREYQTGILTESQFDTMKLWQAGFPNGIAPLGSHLSNSQLWLMRKYFTRVIIMTDNDDPGRSMGRRVAESLKDVRVEWAMFTGTEAYPDGAKDAGDMNDEQIRQCLRNAVPHLDLPG